jgi:nitroreductase
MMQGDRVERCGAAAQRQQGEGEHDGLGWICRAAGVPVYDMILTAAIAVAGQRMCIFASVYRYRGFFYVKIPACVLWIS